MCVLKLGRAEMGDRIWECGGWEGVRFLMQGKAIEGLGVAMCSAGLPACYFIADCSQISWHRRCSVSSKCKYLCRVTSSRHHERWVWFCTQVLHWSFLPLSKLPPPVFCLASSLTGCSQDCRGLMRNLSLCRQGRINQVKLMRLNGACLTLQHKGVAQVVAS